MTHTKVDFVVIQQVHMLEPQHQNDGLTYWNMITSLYVFLGNNNNIKSVKNEAHLKQHPYKQSKYIYFTDSIDNNNITTIITTIAIIII